MRLHDFDDDVQLAVTYELSRSRRIIRRKVYSLLDWLGDIGGLAGAMKALATASIIVFQYKATTSYVSNHTYRVLSDQIDASRDNSNKDLNEKKQKNFKRIRINFFGSIKLSFQRLCSCCQIGYSKRDRLSHASDAFVKQELKIVRWVQLMR